LRFGRQGKWGGDFGVFGSQGWILRQETGERKPGAKSICKQCKTPDKKRK
jgi:hypothetical protein